MLSFLTSSENVTLVACGILLGCTIGDMISSSFLISANNDAVFIFVVFGLAPSCSVVCCLLSSSTIPSVLLCAVWWDLWLLVVTIPESLRSVSLSTGFGVDCLNCTVLWSSFSYWSNLSNIFLQITDLRCKIFNVIHRDLRLLNPTAATTNYVTCRGLHVTGVIRFVPELLLWIQVTLCISCF